MTVYSIVPMGGREKEQKQQIPMRFTIDGEDCAATVVELKRRLEHDRRIKYSSALRFKSSPYGDVFGDDDVVPQKPDRVYIDGPASVVQMLVIELRKATHIASLPKLVPASPPVQSTPPSLASWERQSFAEQAEPLKPVVANGSAAALQKNATSVSVNVSMLGGHTFVARLKMNDTVEALFALLEHGVDMTRNELSLTFEGREVHRNMEVSSLGLSDGCSFVAVMKRRMLPAALMFPGQGSQYLEMMKDVQHIPAVQKMLAKAREILGWDVLELCMQGPDEKLVQTRYAQPCLFCAGLAGMHKLASVNNAVAESYRAVAGLSLGEYTALCVAGVFSFEDGLRLVKLRGEAMQEAAERIPQRMVSIAGLSSKAVGKLCAQAKADEVDAVCSIANYLFPKGFTCAGTEKAVERLRDLAQDQGALQVKMLKTGGGFHTSLMEPARAKLEAALAETLPRMSAPECDVYMNVTGEVLPVGTSPEEICDLLAKQLTATVLWDTCVRNMIKAGVTDFYEVGPMKQLKAMMKRIDATAWGKVVNIEV